MKIPKTYALEKKLDVDLSLSENPLGCSPSVLKSLKNALPLVSTYPESTGKKLRTAFAKKNEILPENVLFGNGSENLIDFTTSLILKPNDEVLIPALTFSLFEKAVKLAKGKVTIIPMDKNMNINLDLMKQKITSKTKLIFICNPNNPTGQLLPRNEIIKFIEDVNPIKVIVDEASIEFGGTSVISEINKFKNLLVLRTFSKAYGLAGLRIGILCTSKDFINKARKIIQPFPLNSLAETAGIAALLDDSFLVKTKQLIKKERRFLINELNSKGFITSNSVTNNIFVTVPFMSADKLVAELKENNISVVNGNNFRNTRNSCFRISIKNREINKKFIEALDLILAVQK